MRETAVNSHASSVDARYLVRLVMLAAAVLLLIFGPGALLATESENATDSYIVKGASSERAAELVVEVGGKVTHELKIIRAVGAELTDSQRDTLAEHPEVTRVWRDREAKVQSAGSFIREAMKINSWVNQE